jgi:CBS domain-containing protein
MTIRKLVEGRDFEVVTCETTATMRDAIAILAERRIGALPVMEHGEVAGIFSERDVVYRIQELGPAALDSSLGSVMTSPAVTVDPDTSVLSALSLMTRRRIRHLPVVEGGRMVDFVSIGDLVKQRIDKIESEAEALRTYIQTA